MTQPVPEVLSESLAYVFERMAFLLCERVDTAVFDPGVDAWLRATMSFEGGCRGTLTVAFPETLCRAAAANMLGVDIDSDSTTVRAADAARELLNVTCGQALVRAFGEAPVFQLHVPSVIPVCEDEVRALAGTADSVVLSVENRFVVARLGIDGDVR